MSGSRCSRNWGLLLCLRIVNKVVLLATGMVLLVYKPQSWHLSHRISGGLKCIMPLIRSASFSGSCIALWFGGDCGREEGASFLIWYVLDIVVPWVVCSVCWPYGSWRAIGAFLISHSSADHMWVRLGGSLTLSTGMSILGVSEEGVLLAGIVVAFNFHESCWLDWNSFSFW